MHAGQAMVQFAEGVDLNAYAIKFFLDTDAFHTEAALYASCENPPLAKAASVPAGRGASPGALGGSPSHARDLASHRQDQGLSHRTAPVRARGLADDVRCWS